MIGYVSVSAPDLLLPKALELVLIPKSDFCKSLHRDELSARELRRAGVQRTSTWPRADAHAATLHYECLVI